MFERFTDRARLAVVRSQEEARQLGHGYIGTEHLLLGLLGEGGGVAAQALTSLGASLERVRALVSEIVGTGGSHFSDHVPFTARAKKVLELALREALQLQNDYIGTEHLLLGLVREGDGVAAQVLTRLGIDLGLVRQRVVQILSSYESEDTATSASVQTVPIGTSGIAGIFEPALHEARRLGDDRVDAEHVLLAAFESQDAVAGKVLRSFGLTKASVEQRIREIRGEGSQTTPE